MPQPHLNERDAAAVHVRERVMALPELSPKARDARLVALGYRGQEHARRAASVMAYRHVRRLRRVFVEGVAPHELGPRENYLFIGPTGCGKTFLVEVLFREILHVPF